MTLGRYAEHTSVPVDRSRSEIERVLTKYGATKYGSMSEENAAAVYFRVKGRECQIRVPMPREGEPKNPKHVYNKWRKVEAAAEQRRRWRVLLITVKSLLEAVESKVLTFDEAFLPYIVIPSTGRTMSQMLSTPQLDALYNGSSLKALVAGTPE